MGDPTVSRRAIRSVEIAVIAGAVLLGSGLLSQLYISSDPNPAWWYTNYPWIRFVSMSLLFAGVLTSTVGTSLSFLETFIMLDQGLLTKVGKIEYALKRPSLRKLRIQKLKPTTGFPMETTITKRPIVVPDDQTHS